MLLQNRAWNGNMWATGLSNWKADCLQKNGKDMMVDPKPSEIKLTTVCWPIEGHSNQLSWDLMMYYRRTQGRIDGAKMVQFFRYKSKIGRKIILKQEHKDIAARKFWIQEGIGERRLAKFWKMIWHDNGDRKIMMCLWLIVHRALSLLNCLKIWR